MYKIFGGVLLLSLISLCLYTCSMPLHSSSSNQDEVTVVPSSDQPGMIKADYKSGTISLVYHQGDSQPSAIRIFDKSGQLVYGERAPKLEDQKPSFINFGHMPVGEYQILVLLAGGSFLEDWVSITR